MSKTSRDALLQAAERLFADRGYDAVSTRDIAEEAQVNLGAIQYHFGSKAKLFVETVHRLMQSGASVPAQVILGGPITSQEDAAGRLCRFIFTFLNYSLRPKGPQACRLMYREVLNEGHRDDEMFDQLVSSVVDEFIRPLEKCLVDVLHYITPDSSRKELELTCQSIIGQCSYYTTHRPFAEHLRNTDFSKIEELERIAKHIATFSLRALGCSEKIIASAIREVFENKAAA